MCPRERKRASRPAPGTKDHLRAARPRPQRTRGRAARRICSSQYVLPSWTTGRDRPEIRRCRGAALATSSRSLRQRAGAGHQSTVQILSAQYRRFPRLLSTSKAKSAVYICTCIFPLLLSARVHVCCAPPSFLPPPCVCCKPSMACARISPPPRFSRVQVPRMSWQASAPHLRQDHGLLPFAEAKQIIDEILDQSPRRRASPG